MKTTKFLFLATFALCFALACSEDKELPTDESARRQPELPQLPDTGFPFGESWQFVAFVNSADGLVKIPESLSENSYWITFNNDGTLSAKSSVNELEGSYTFNSAASTLSISALGGSKINEQPDGDLFVQQLQSIQSFSVGQSSLKLYHNEKDYLLFTELNDEPEIMPLDNPDIQYLISAPWQFVAFVSAVDYSSRVPESLASNPNDYRITFRKDGTFLGKSSPNLIGGTYEIDPQSLTFKLQANFMTEILESPDGELFFETLNASHHYTITPTSLRIYFAKNDHLLFTIN
ncbi:MAG: META domain-containing protein [Tannerellaceae bacterium]|jgi:heat shock protein HslJ|nr:META domain-containing protein [Tannerellaceae bacterium]